MLVVVANRRSERGAMRNSMGGEKFLTWEEQRGRQVGILAGLKVLGKNTTPQIARKKKVEV